MTWSIERVFSRDPAHEHRAGGTSLPRALLVCAALLLLISPSETSVLRVPSEVPSIGLALSTASPFDTILVAADTYEVNLVWPSTPGIKLLGEEGAKETVLDGRGAASVIGVYSGVDTTTIVRGFTILNGFAEGG
ncbi:MAG: hypothetical protein ABIH26_01375 [Candidatus Eisenbacteria bacterium]